MEPFLQGVRVVLTCNTSNHEESTINTIQVTLGMCLVGALPYIRGLFLLIAQILGGITAAAISSAILPGPLTVRTSLGGGTSIVRGLFIDMFLTSDLVFTIFMLAAEKHKGTFIAPIGIGLSLFIAELVGKTPLL